MTEPVPGGGDPPAASKSPTQDDDIDNKDDNNVQTPEVENIFNGGPQLQPSRDLRDFMHDWTPETALPGPHVDLVAEELYSLGNCLRSSVDVNQPATIQDFRQFVALLFLAQDLRQQLATAQQEIEDLRDQLTIAQEDHNVSNGGTQKDRRRNT